MVVATGEMGELGIAPRHAPLITRLKPGQVRVILEDGDAKKFYVSGGILDVQPQVVTVLPDPAVRPKHIDEPAPEAAQDEGERHNDTSTARLTVAQTQARLAKEQTGTATH